MPATRVVALLVSAVVVCGALAGCTRVILTQSDDTVDDTIPLSYDTGSNVARWDG